MWCVEWWFWLLFVTKSPNMSHSLQEILFHGFWKWSKVLHMECSLVSWKEELSTLHQEEIIFSLPHRLWKQREKNEINMRKKERVTESPNSFPVSSPNLIPVKVLFRLLDSVGFLVSLSLLPMCCSNYIRWASVAWNQTPFRCLCQCLLEINCKFLTRIEGRYHHPHDDIQKNQLRDSLWHSQQVLATCCQPLSLSGFPGTTLCTIHTLVKIQSGK